MVSSQQFCFTTCVRRDSTRLSIFEPHRFSLQNVLEVQHSFAIYSQYMRVRVRNRTTHKQRVVALGAKDIERLKH